MKWDKVTDSNSFEDHLVILLLSFTRLSNSFMTTYWNCRKHKSFSHEATVPTGFVSPLFKAVRDEFTPKLVLHCGTGYCDMTVLQLVDEA